MLHLLQTESYSGMVCMPDKISAKYFSNKATNADKRKELYFQKNCLKIPLGLYQSSIAVEKGNTKQELDCHLNQD